MKPTVDEISNDLSAIAGEMVEDWGLELSGIDASTRLSRDLCFSSVDLLNFFASVDVRYQRRLPYESLLMDGSAYRDELTLGQLAEFIHREFDNGAAMRREV